LKFGVILGNDNAASNIARLARVAEECGFDHLLLSDHYWYEDAPDLLDSWALIGYLSGITSTLRLGTCVTPITFRPPLQFAKVVSTLDIASGGRIIVGVGMGWHEPEFRMFSRWYPHRERYAQFDEALQILIQAWTDETVTFSGRFYHVERCIVEPKPMAKPYPPLWFGGWSRRMKRQAGRMGDGWIPTGPRSGEAVKSHQDYKMCVKEIEKSLSESGRGPEKFAFGCRFGPMESPKEHLSEVEAFSSVGLRYYQLGLNPKKHSAEILRYFADSVMACF